MTARLSSTHLFSQIARENLEKIPALERKLDLLRIASQRDLSDDETLRLYAEIDSVDEELGKSIFITIVFSAVALEAYIYDYAARHLDDSYVRDYIDRLDTVSKWVVIPRLITGQELSKEGKWLQLLKNLVAERNSIIHNKSLEISNSSKGIRDLQKLHKKDIGLPIKAREAVELLDILVDEMINLDREEGFFVISHLQGTHYLSEEK